MARSLSLVCPALHRRALLAGLAPLQAGGAWAACSRVRVPMAPGGLLVREEQGRAQGVMVDLVAALQRRLNCPVESALVPQGRLIRSFYETFEADVLMPGSPLPFEGHTPHFVALFKVQAHFVGQAARRWKAADVATLAKNNLRCVLPRSVTYGPDFDALVRLLDGQGRVSWVRDVGTVLRMLAAGRVDFTLLSPTVVYAYGGGALYSALHILALPGVRAMETGAAVSRRSLPESAQAAVVAALGLMAREGDVTRAFARHFPAAVLQQDSPALPRA